MDEVKHRRFNRVTAGWKLIVSHAIRSDSLFAAKALAPDLLASCAMNEDGVGFKVVGMDGDTRLFADCDVCGGTARAVVE